MSVRTELQEYLGEDRYSRDLTDLRTYMRRSGLSFDDLFFEAARRTKGEYFCFLDVGCGAGHVAEDIHRLMGLELLRKGLRRPVRAFGIDIQPQTSPLYARRGAKLFSGDARDLQPFKENSIDMVVSIQTLLYVQDPLAAIQSGWRILKDKGIAVWEAYQPAFTSPNIQEILRETPGGEAFEVLSPKLPRIYIICRKEGNFNGFPFEVDQVSHPFGEDVEKPHRRFFNHTTYKPL